MKNVHPIFQRLLAPFAPAKPNIITVHEYPPIPIRTMDWRAYRDGDEESPGRHGWGRTEQDAIADLIAMEESGYI